MPYTPRLKGVLALHWMNTLFDIILQNTYTDQRFLSSTNLDKLPPYLLTNIKWNYKVRAKKSQYNFGLGIDNLLDQNYQEIMGAFMPLRNYYINFSVIVR